MAVAATPPSNTTVPRFLVTAIGITEASYAAAVALPMLIGLGRKVQEIAPDGKATTLGLLAAVMGITMVIANPASGHLSDRTTSRIGMRRPWILGGAVTAAAGLLLLATAQSIAMLAVSMVLIPAGTQALVAALTATLVDQFPAPQRIRIAGTFSMWNLAGVVPALAIAQVFPQSLLIQFALVAAILLASAAALCVVLPDIRLDRAERRPVNLGSLARALLTLPAGANDYKLLLLQRFLVSCGIGLIASYSLYYLQDRLAMDPPAAAALVGTTYMITTALSAMSAYVAGRWATRLGRGRPFLFWATITLAGTLVLKAATASLAIVVLVAVLSGIALGVYYAVDLGMVTQVLPDERDAGRYLGTFAVAKQLPSAVAPAVAPLLLAVGSDPFSGGPNYLVLFLACGLATVAGVPLVRRLRTVR